jgi:molecular chaperone Hsp33
MTEHTETGFDQVLQFTVPARDARGRVVRLGPVLDTVLSHRSVRAFTPETLAPGTLELLVAAAQSAASSSNLSERYRLRVRAI